MDLGIGRGHEPGEAHAAAPGGDDVREAGARGAADRLVQRIVVTVPAAAVVAAGPAEAHVDRLDAQRGRVRRHPVDAADDPSGAPAAVRVEDLHRVDLRPRRDANDSADGAVVLRADDAGDERAVAVVVLRRRAGRDTVGAIDRVQLGLRRQVDPCVDHRDVRHARLVRRRGRRGADALDAGGHALA